jgi:hypothetical protein
MVLLRFLSLAGIMDDGADIANLDNPMAALQGAGNRKSGGSGP